MNRIKEILKEKDMSQHDLANMTGIHQKDLSDIILEKSTEFSLKNAAKIARALNRPTEYIFPDFYKD